MYRKFYVQSMKYYYIQHSKKSADLKTLLLTLFIPFKKMISAHLFYFKFIAIYIMH